MTGASAINCYGIVKLRLTALPDAQYGVFTTGASPVTWGSVH